MDRNGGGGGGGGKSRTDLLAAGRKKLQQYRKKKEKKPSGKKTEADADAEAEEGTAKAGAETEEAVPEPTSPVGLALIAGGDGNSNSNSGSKRMPPKEAEQLGMGQCNGEEPSTAESNTVENPEVVPIKEEEGGERNVQDVSTSEQGSLGHESHRPGGEQDSAIQVTGVDGGGDIVEGSQQVEVNAVEGLPDCNLKENVELQISSQGDRADDGSNQLEETQQVGVDSAEKPPNFDLKENTEVLIPSQGSGADDPNPEEGAQEMEIDASVKPSGGDLKEDTEPTVSSEIGVEVGHNEESTVASSHEIPENTARGATIEEADRVGEEAVQADPCMTSVREEAVVTNNLNLQSQLIGAVDEPSCEKGDPALFGGAIAHVILPDDFEDIQSHLYLTALSRDILLLQLGEQSGLNSEVTQRSDDEVSKLQVLLKETEESKLAVGEELQQCRYELQDMNTVKGKLELIMASLTEEINASNSRCEQLEYELHSSKENVQHMLTEFADCRTLLETLQKENSELTANIAFEKEERNKVVEDLQHLSSKNKELSSELSELELIYASVKEEMNASNCRCEKLEHELHSSKENTQHTLNDLMNCRELLETLQKENLELTANLTFEKEARKTLEEENEYLSNEKQKLSAGLSELNEELLLSYAKHKQLESHIREMKTYFEQLTERLIEEILYATSRVDMYQSVIEELDDNCNLVPSPPQIGVHQENVCQVHSSKIIIENPEKIITNSSVVGHGNHERSHHLVNEKDLSNSAALQVLKGHLEEAKGDLHDIEKLVQRICSRSDGSVLVSKLIKSFESKGNQADPGTSEGECGDLPKLTQELVCCLREKFKQMSLDLAKAEEHVAQLCNGRELSIQVEKAYEAERQQNVILQTKMDELAGKLSNYKDAIGQIHNQLASVQQDADNNAGRLFSQAELLQKDFADRIFILENERVSLTNLLTEVTDKLSSSRGIVFPNDESEGLSSRALNCVDFATKSLQSLHEKLEAAQIDNAKLITSLSELDKAHSDVLERSEQASGYVKKMCNALQELLHDSYENVDESGIGHNAEEPIEAMFSLYQRLIEHVQNLLDDRLFFLSKNADLESILLSKCEEAEELSVRCSSLRKDMDDIGLLKEKLQSVSSSKNAVLEELHGRCLALAEKLAGHLVNYSSSVLPWMSDSSVVVEKFSKEHYILTSLLPCIEDGVASCIQKFEKASGQIHVSKVCLQEANIFGQISLDKWSLSLPTLIKEEIIPKFCDLQDRMDQLSALNIQLETEVPALRDGLKKLEEAVKISCTELQQKVSELEQSEQKLSSVKEKLSIAVAKGKGLIVQRDSLKQSLLEKTGELEKLLQELQSKEAMLKELEAKLKSYTEADRIEALESELSYIRNSATALRDSFLQKDSVLQRIEEVLEDLDLPEHFHSRDIVEKIELLSKMAVGASFSLPDGDKRSSVDGHSDSGAAMDGLNDVQNSNSNLNPGSDELKNKCDELHRRFYDLAEHNNMLEQSLVERNSIIQKWEEVLGQISIPSQFGMLEPEDRISWLGNRLLEVEHERDALQLKIEHLEDSSEMLIVDLEESHKRISELSAEVVAIKAEKDFFSESLEKLRFEFLGLSEKAVQDEFVRDNLQKDLAVLQEKLTEKTEESKHFHEMEIEIHKLLDLVRNALQDRSSAEIPSGGSAAVLSLGELLSKLLDDYGILLSESTRGGAAEREIQLGETKLSNDTSAPKTGEDDKEIALTTLSNELEHAHNNLALVEQQRDDAVEKAQSLMLEMEELHAQINQMQEGSADQTLKYQSLVLELELLGKQRDNLQEQLNQEEQKCASLREKLNVAVRKGKGLVQHRDSLKQTMEEMNAVMEKLKNERKQHIEALESEKSSFMGRLAENEKSLQDTRQYLTRLLNALNAVDVTQDFDMDPITKIEKIASFCHDLRETLISSENEVKKSKRATELLLAELNEAQERADGLQEELMKAESALSQFSRQHNVLEARRADAIHRLEHFMSLQSQARRKQLDHLKELNSSTSQLRNVCFELSQNLVNTFSKDVDLICYMESFMKSSGKRMGGANMVDIPITSNRLLSNSISNKKAHIPNAPLELKMDDSDESQIVQHLAIMCHAVSDCVKDCDDLKRTINEHGFSVDQKATELFNVMANLQNRFTSQSNELESLRGNFLGLQSEIKEKEDEILSMHRNMGLLIEACSSSVAEIEGITSVESSEQSYYDGQNQLFADDHIRSVAEKLVAAIKRTRNSNEGSSKELKATILELQQTLQAKDIQISTISAELTSQIREAESSGKRLSVDLEEARMKVSNLEKQVEVLISQKKTLETQVSKLKNSEAVASELHGRVKELTDALSGKEQEIEGLMQALDEEDKELEVLENRSNELEQMLQEKEFALKSLEVSRTKALTKLATTVDKFDELHNLSESLLAEVEDLQSQLQERDSEISFLRQEVTRSTNELLNSEEINKKYSSQINDFVKWLETALLRFGMHYESTDDYDGTQIPVYMDILGKKIGSMISQSDDLRVTVQSKDSLLQVERTKMEELLRKTEALEASLSQKESQIGLLHRERTTGQSSRTITLPGTSEIEQVNDKVSPAAAVTQIRGIRKVISDQVAIDLEMDKDKPLDDEDDDKAHGFKPLMMSHIVPKFTRPIADRIDGVWASGDRLLMRQPTLRLGVLIYWIMLHALLASFI